MSAEPHAFLPSPNGDLAYCMGPGNRGLGICGEHADHEIHGGRRECCWMAVLPTHACPEVPHAG